MKLAQVNFPLKLAKSFHEHWAKYNESDRTVCDFGSRSKVSLFATFCPYRALERPGHPHVEQWQPAWSCFAVITASYTSRWLVWAVGIQCLGLGCGRPVCLFENRLKEDAFGSALANVTRIAQNVIALICQNNVRKAAVVCNDWLIVSLVKAIASGAETFPTWFPATGCLHVKWVVLLRRQWPGRLGPSLLELGWQTDAMNRF